MLTLTDRLTKNMTTFQSDATTVMNVSSVQGLRTNVTTATKDKSGGKEMDG